MKMKDYKSQYKSNMPENSFAFQLNLIPVKYACILIKII